MDSENNKYYFEYKKFCDELNSIQKVIEDYLKDFSIKTKEGDNTTTVENSIKEKIKSYQELQSKLSYLYSGSKAPAEISGAELVKRQKEIQKFGFVVKSLQDSFDATYKQKYGTSNLNFITEDYSQKEEYKNMSPEELLALEKTKLTKQDDKLEDIYLDVKKGTQLAKNANHEIKEQNKKLEQLNDDMERTDEKMKKVTGKFEKFVAHQSSCKMIIIMIIELAIALGCYLLLWT